MRSLTVLIVTAIAAASLEAQTVATVDSGMTRAQVVAALGEPLSVHSFGSFTYLFYRNGCEKKCGMNDIVLLDSGAVVDAIFRSPARRYSGTSSSPRMITAPKAKQGAGAPLKVPPADKPPVSPTKPPPKKPPVSPAQSSLR